MESITQKMRKENSCFNYEKRLMLEGYLLGKKGLTKITKVCTLARIFGCDRKTIRNEIKRGLVDHERSDFSIVWKYNADRAQLDADEKNANRGRLPAIMRDKALAREIKRYIVDMDYSPYAAHCELEKHWPSETRACEKTIYNWVNGGYVHGVTKEDLPNKGVKYKEKGSTRRYKRAECAAHSIELRPKEVEERKTFGHWEGDTVKGRQKGSTECLLTLTERKTRFEVAYKMPDAKATTTVEMLDKIEREIGSEEFRRAFVTITFDGGSEFLDIAGIERSCIDGKERTKVYIAHPYSACERGTNERHNRELRRFFPKGTDFADITDEQVANAVDWMNNYPRRILGGFSPRHFLEKTVPL